MSIDDIRTIVLRILAEQGQRPGPLLEVLHCVQEAVGYVPSESVAWIADGLNLSRAEVHGVISFYHYFRTTPAGRHTIRVCRAEACQSMGARALEAHLQQRLRIG